MDEMKQIKKILLFVLVILVLQVVFSSMIYYRLSRQTLPISESGNINYPSNSEMPGIISQVNKNSTQILGNAQAPVEITMFADFECPYCNQEFTVLKSIVNNYKDQIKFSFHHYPLNNHKNAMQAALALEAAGKQNKYWDMYDLLIEGYKSQGDKALEKEQILKYAERIDLDIAVFQSDLNEKKGMEVIQKDLDNGKKLGIKGIPTVFLNNQKIEGIQDYDYFSKLIDEVLGAKS